LTRVYSTPAGCEAVASRFLSGAGGRWDHVRLVAKTLDELAAGLDERDLLVSAAWLHDIGYAPELVTTGMHAVDGAEYLRRTGAPDRIASLVAFHTGAEYEGEERGLSRQLGRFEPPAQDDLDVLILADLTSGPVGERVTVEERLDEILRRYEVEHPVHQAVRRSRGYLEACCERAAARVGYPM
jgi:putative nucleotidyltransferase with HDIG domain